MSYQLSYKWYTHPDFAQYADGTKRIQNDSRAFIQSLGYAYDEKTNTYRGIKPNEKRIALFAHEGAGMAFLSSVLGIPYPMFCTHFGLQHSGVSVIRFDGEAHVIPQLLQLSNDSHLYKDGLPLCYNDEIRI